MLVVGAGGRARRHRRRPARRRSRLAAYFVAAESLANTARYAQANRVEVRIQPRAGELHVEVADDGVGGADVTAGTGLSGLADRVEVLKGCFDVESPPGAGTRVHASIPLEA